MQSKIIAAIAFTCLPVMGFSETPPVVWACDTISIGLDEEELENDEATVSFTDHGWTTYFRPETFERFQRPYTWIKVQQRNTWIDMCDDENEGSVQVVLTEDGCFTTWINEERAGSTM